MRERVHLLLLLLASSCGGAGTGIPPLNTLRGDDAFPVRGLVESYGVLADGGEDLGTVTITMAEVVLPALCPPSSGFPTGPYHELVIHIRAALGETVKAGTFPIDTLPAQAGYADLTLSALDAQGSLGSMPMESVGVSGTLTCTEVNAAHAACSFSTELSPVNTLFPPKDAFDGAFDAPSHCPDAGA